MSKNSDTSEKRLRQLRQSQLGKKQKETKNHPTIHSLVKD